MSASRSPSPSPCAALIDGRIDAVWARVVRPWTLGAWAFLTLGIAMGSYWAYYELGWGGWWFWDPVENASLMPWLAGHRASAFHRGDGKARRAEGLDDPARHPHLLAVAARHLPGPLRRAHLGALLRGRSRRAASSSSAFSWCSSAARLRCSRGARRCCSRAGFSRRSRAKARSCSTTCSSRPPARRSSSARSTRSRSRR